MPTSARAMRTATGGSPRRLSPLVERLLAPHGLLVADRAFDLPGCTDVSTEAGVERDRYFVYRRLPFAATTERERAGAAD